MEISFSKSKARSQQFVIYDTCKTHMVTFLFLLNIRLMMHMEGGRFSEEKA
ncbi:hypothetical protein NC653_036891 [Populus alba x Populus x berolinensis]|uniref:Uncharacterized protein n=1 Tax=Populus alba x Populus x berolinensis TaxID=444605 RepID=A0AAD6PVH2_9ROSI|nr:hypothetical protein NC653_036891 [Populus alba x Populus x berolinensis]